MEFFKGGTSSFIPSYAQGLSILLVDHDTTSLVYIASMLEHFSFKVTTTQLASVAMSMIIHQKDRFKLLMANVNMPDMDSFSFLRIVVEKGVPVVGLTSERSVDTIGRALAEGASFCLDKPIALEDLKYVWQHVFRRKRRSWIHRVSTKKTVLMVDNIGEQIQRGVVITEDVDAPIATDDYNLNKGKGKEIEIIHQEHCRQMEFDVLNEDQLTNDEGSTALHHTGIETTLSSQNQGGLMTTRPTCSKIMHHTGIESPLTPLNQNQGGLMTTRPSCSTVLHHTGMETALTPLSQNQGGLITTRPTCSKVLLHHTGIETSPTPLGQNQFGFMTTRPTYDKRCKIKENKDNKINGKDVTVIEEANRNQRTYDESRPKTILEEMKVPGLTVNHVASRLQKFKSVVKQISEDIARNSSAANNGRYGHWTGRQNANSDIGGNNFPSIKTPRPVFTPPSIAPTSSQTKHGSVYPGISQKPHSAGGQSSSRNVGDVLKPPTGFTGDATHLIEFWNAVNTPGRTIQRGNKQLNPMQVENSTSANLQIAHKAANEDGNPVAVLNQLPDKHVENATSANLQRTRKGATNLMETSNQQSNKQVKNVTATNRQTEEKGVTDVINPMEISNHLSMQVANATSANLKKPDKDATDVSDLMAIGYADLLNILAEEPANFKGLTDKYHNESNSTVQDKDVNGFSESLSASINQSQFYPPSTGSFNLSDQGVQRFKDKLPVDMVHKNQEQNASKFSDPLATWFDPDKNQYVDGWNTIGGEPSTVADKKSPSEFVYQNQGLNAVIASANQSAGVSNQNEDILANIDWENVLNEPMDFEADFPLDLTNMNLKMDAAAELNTTAIVYNKSSLVGHGYALLSKVIEDDSDGSQRLPGEPDPDDIDRYCEWLTSFSIE